MPEDFKTTPELLELEEKIGVLLGEYLRKKNAELYKQEAGSDDDAYEQIPDDYFLTAWCVAGEYQHMDPDKRAFVMGSQPRHVSLTHARGIANYWF